MLGSAGHRRGVLGLVGTAALVTSLAACGGTAEEGEAADPGTSAATSADPALVERVPAAIKADGKIVVGTDASYPPAEFVDEDSEALVGYDVDLFAAVAAKLGLKVEYESISLDQIIAGLTPAGKYEIGVSSFNVTPTYKSQALMVSYFNAGSQWATAAGNPAGVNPNDVCGKKVAVQQDTAQSADLGRRSKKCTDAKKAAITIDPYPGVRQAADALAAGKDDALLADSPAGGYYVKQSGGKLALLGEVFEPAPFGYVVGKDQQAFAEVVRDALKALIAEGTYASTLERWGVQGGAIKEPAINP